MMRNYWRNRQQVTAWLVLIALLAMPVSMLAQTQISYHSNRYKPSDDVKLGRQAAAEAEQQFPLLQDPQVRDYVERVGQRLVAAIPPEFQHPEFRYYFKVVNASDINAFALPGGPMYINRGMIEAAHREGEMAGVMAHELSHVALRHGTAQATKAQKYSILSGIAGIAGSILGGPAVGQLAQMPFGVYFLKFSREYETEADLLGARIMANAGYDPMDLANMFRTIERQGGGGGGFLSDHPSPADRYNRIAREAQLLRVRNSFRDSGEFSQIQARLRSYPSAQSTAEILRSGQRYPTQEGRNYPSNNYPSNPTGRVDYPSSRYRSYNVGAVQVSIPDNWVELRQDNSVWYAPEGGYGQAGFTHGVNIGFAQTQSTSLSSATNELINSLMQGNRNLRSGGTQRTTLDGHSALLTTLSNVNEATGRPEIIRLMTTQLRNGQLLYLVFVEPSADARVFDNAFNNILRSIRLND
ncbi:MAG TPA: M48 family metallopeptidase [Pyrinomonadaceae bacterium]|nr:M48 family metallopeptidase [Pyrinomonadaceae bacterium]